MYLLEIDSERRRVHIILSDDFDGQQAEELFDQLLRRQQELNPDFHVLCDLTTLDAFDAAARPHFRAVMDLCNKIGVKKVIRIVPDPLNNFGLTIMSHIHYDSGIPVITCKTLKEANKYLSPR